MSLDTYEEAVILFARSPVREQVKTRLQPYLSPDESLQLHRAMLHDAMVLVDDAARTPPRRRELRLTAALAPGDELAAALSGWEIALQQGDDLGERLIHAFQDSLHRGIGRVVAIGSDCPAMTPDYLEAAFQALSTQEMVVGPAQDGGYVLIGCSRLHIRPFQNIPWGTDRVLSQTRKMLKRLHVSHSLLQVRRDLDTPDDLFHVHGELQHLAALGVSRGAHTLACLRELMARHPEWPHQQ